MPFWDKLRKIMFSEAEEAPREVLAAAPADPGSESQDAAPPAVAPAEGEQTPAPALDLEICLQTDLGAVRTNNEDRGIYERPSDPAVADARGTLVIIADGMGGASAGEVASEMAIRMIPDLYYKSPKPPGPALKEALEVTSAAIHRNGQEDPELRGMGTTCVAMAILAPELWVAYVGDTRLYLLRDDGFYQLTEDHTVVGEMVRKGILTREQARNHEERNVLSLSMGGRPEIVASYWDQPMLLRAGDRLLMCSDGLYDLVADQEIQAVIAGAPIHLAVQELIETAKRKGGHDNITVALVRVFVKKNEPEADSKATREFMISS